MWDSSKGDEDAVPHRAHGFVGEAVKTLQAALNLWPQSLKPQLMVDGSFGPKTDGKVREFQSKLT